MAYLNPRETQTLLALVEADHLGLTKKEAGKKLNISEYMADLSMHMLKVQGYSSFEGSRYYVTDAGKVRAAQLQIPGMNL